MLTFCEKLGLTEYDHDDSKAKALEAEIGIRVLRHSKILDLLRTLFKSLGYEQCNR